MIKYCHECGTEIKEGAKFCKNCGTSIVKDLKEESNKREIKEEKQSFESSHHKYEIEKQRNQIYQWIAIAIILLVLGVLFFWAYDRYEEKQKENEIVGGINKALTDWGFTASKTNSLNNSDAILSRNYFTF